MRTDRIIISPGVTVAADAEMIAMLAHISEHCEISLDELNLQQQEVVAKMTGKALLIKRRKNGKVSYKVRPGVCWNQT